MDDDADVFFRMEQQAQGVISASQVAHGDENNLKFRIYGEEGALEWSNTDHNTLLVKKQGAPTQIYRTGVDHSYLHEATHLHMRTPSGHPEGYIEAFANIYRNFSDHVRQFKAHSSPDSIGTYPNIDDGFKGMALVAAVVASSADGNICHGVRPSARGTSKGQEQQNGLSDHRNGTGTRMTPARILHTGMRLDLGGRCGCLRTGHEHPVVTTMFT